MENPFVTIKTFSYPHELAVIRAVLEANGIECFVQDELTIQVDPFYSNAIGGVKLKVRQNDFERASEILNEGGYEAEKRDLQLDFQKFRRFTSKIKLLSPFRVEVQLIIVVSLLFAIICGLYYFFVVHSE